jgi:membrane protease YdiL (CAAX protease family)
MSPPTASKSFLAVLSAIAVTAAAWGTVYFWTRVAMDWTGPRLALGIAVTIGYGLVGRLALRDEARPWTAWVGLRPFSLSSLFSIVLLVPALLLAMEIEALVRLAFGRTGGVGVFEWVRGLITGASGLPLFGSVFLFVVLVPAVSEWFFRGVVQQGLVERLGRTRGVLLTALLYAVAVAGARAPASSWIAVAAAAFGLGLLLGGIRVTSGSVVASALLHGGFNLVGVVGWMVSASTPVPAFTAPGSSLPVAVLVPAALSVAAGSVLLWRDWKRLP